MTDVDLEIDTLNKFGVSSHIASGDVVLLMPPASGRRISRADALNLAAYLVVMSNATDEELDRVRRAIAST